MEENQSTMQQTGVQGSGMQSPSVVASQTNSFVKPSLREWTQNFNDTQLNLRKAQQKQNYNDENQMQTNLYSAWLQSNNKVIASKSNKAIRIHQTAAWIKDYYTRLYPEELNNLWINFDDWWSDQDTVKWYIKNNPSSEAYLKDYITTETDINDPMDFYNTMWWLATKEEEIAQWKLNVIDWWVADMSRNFVSWIDESAIWVRNFINGIEWIWNNDALYFWAMENYAHEVLGKDTTQLTDLEIYGIQEALKNEEIFKQYEPTPWKAFTKTVAWWTDTLFTIAAPFAKSVISALSATPWTDKWMELVWKAQMWIWEVVNGLVPPLRAFRSTLTDADQKEFDAWVGSIVTMGLLKKYGGKAKMVTKEMYKDFVETTWADKIISKFKSSVKGSSKPTNNKPTIWLNELRTTNKWLNQEVDDIVRRVIKWDKSADVFRRAKISRGLSELTPEESTSYRNAYETLQKKWDTLKTQIDDVLKKDTNTYGREDVMLKETNRITWKQTQVDVFERMLDWLIKANENWPNERATYEYYREKLINGEITLDELNKIDRAFNTEFNDSMYTDKWGERHWLNADDARRLRKWGKEVIRTLWDQTGIEELSYDNLKALDEQYSDLIDARDYMENMSEWKANYEATRHIKTEWEELWEVASQWMKAVGAARRMDVQGIKNAFTRGVPESATFAELEAELPDSVRRLIDLNKNIKSNNAAIKSMERLDFSGEWEGFSKLRSKKADYMIVSAENPMWEPATPEYNAEKTQAFRDFLDENGIQWKAQKWMYDNPENSQIIAIDNPQQRIIIDERLEANSPQNENIIVKWGKAYRYDPRTQKAYMVDLTKDPIDVAWDATNFYSELDGRKYKLPLYDENIEQKVSKKNFLDVYQN